MIFFTVILRKPRVLERGLSGGDFGSSPRVSLNLYLQNLAFPQGYFDFVLSYRRLSKLSTNICPFLDGNFEFSAGSPSSNFNALQVNSYDAYIILIINIIGYVKN